MRTLPFSMQRRRRLLGTLALLLAVFTAFVVPAGAADAAVGTPSGAAASAKHAASTTQQNSKSAATAAPRRVTKPVAPAKAAKPATVSAGTARQDRAASARAAVGHATAASTCSGQISPDVVYPCDAPSSTGTDTFTLSLADSSDQVFVQALSTTGSGLAVSVTAPDGTTLNCQGGGESFTLLQCPTSVSGSYTLAVTNGGSDYTLSYMPLLSDTTCSSADTSFSAATLQGSVAAGAVGGCYTVSAPAGDVLLDYFQTQYLDSSYTWGVYDSTGAVVCGGLQYNCTLTGTGPYRIFFGSGEGRAYSYYLEVHDLTDPTGCSAVAQQTYGTVPDTSSADECRSLTVAASGQYQIYAASTDGVSGSLYTTAGATACTNSGPFCQLTPGTYDFVLAPGSLQYTFDFGVVFIAANESQGCTATGDTDFSSGAASGTFAGVGEEVCLTLPTASGLDDYMFDQDNADGSAADVMYVVDSTGAQQCSNANFEYTVCDLSGTAPFRVLLTEGYQDTAYRLLVQQTGSSAGCTVWPQSGFGGTWGASVSVTAENNLACLSIPAAQHSVGEMIDYSNDANQVDGNITVYDQSGDEVCQGTSETICSYTSGDAYTALVDLVSTTVKSDTFHVVRRDVSQTATCSTPSSTTVGGPSASYSLTSDLDTVCERVSAATTDDLWLSVRTEAPSGEGAVLEVTNAAGAIVCRQWGASCQVTGDTDYQVIVTADNYAGETIAAHVDTWRVGTAAGWASQCTSNSLSPNGWEPVTATLSETATAYCAVVPLTQDETFDIAGSDTAPSPDIVGIGIWTASNWTGGSFICSQSNVGQFGFSCGTGQLTQPAEGVLLVTLGSAQSPTGFTMQGVCQFGCTRPAAASINGIQPYSQPASASNEVVITGQNLNLATTVMLDQNGSPAQSYQISQPISVNPAGTSMTLGLDTAGLAPGSYDVALDSAPCSVGQGGPQCLPGDYEVTAAQNTAAGQYVPVSPVRILDTRSGLGAPKARVAGNGTLTLTVAGVAGVPATGVTAVSLDLTAVDPATIGFLVAYPNGQSTPGTSDDNFAAGQNVTNLVTVPVVNGQIEIHNASSGQVDVLADLAGYFTSAGTGSGQTSLTPTRILDTGSGLGAPKAAVPTGGTVTLTVAGSGGVPTSGVTAVALDLTVFSPGVGGFLEAYPYGSARPTFTDLTFANGESTTGLAVVPVSDGKVVIYNAGGAVNIAADVVGYYAASGSGFQGIGPVRVLDTRSGLGGAGGAIASDADAVLPIDSVPGLSGNATSVVLDVLVTGAQDAGRLTVYADGTPVPAVSNVVFAAGQTVADQVVVPYGSAIDFLNDSGGTVQVIADAEGYYTS